MGPIATTITNIAEILPCAEIIALCRIRAEILPWADIMPYPLMHLEVGMDDLRPIIFGSVPA